MPHLTVRFALSTGLALALLSGVAIAQTQTSGQGNSGQAAQQGPLGGGTGSNPSASPSPGASASPTASSSPSATSAATVMTTQGNLGTFLTDAQGKSLYEFEADTSGTSTCTGACVAVWPPLTVSSGETPQAGGSAQSSLMGTIQRPDGTTQVTYNGKPLYHYVGDTSAGMTTGQGLNSFGALWFLLNPDGTALKTSTNSAGNAGSSPMPSGSGY